jgi:acetyl esterase/lipase
MRYGVEIGSSHFDGSAAPGAPSASIVTKQNLSYPGGQGALQMFNLYAPRDYLSVHHPVLIWLHGGGWAIGDKSDWLSQAVSVKAAMLGFVVFNVNYRLNNDAHPAPFPSASDDVAAFVRFIAQHPELANSTATTPISIGGHSAGGQLALYEASNPRSSYRFRCVIDMSGVSDLTSTTLPAALQHYVNAFALTSQLRADASPIKRTASWRAERVLFLHARDDATVPIEQSIEMAARLAQRPNAPMIVNIFPVTAGHDLPVSVMDDALARFAPDNCA